MYSLKSGTPLVKGSSAVTLRTFFLTRISLPPEINIVYTRVNQSSSRTCQIVREPTNPEDGEEIIPLHRFD
jgi:hypothetical protein